jgi:choline dehydrogenase
MVRTGSDAIVVGGGTAGSVVAGRLVEAGLRVTILEAGPDYGPADSGRWPQDLLRVSASLPVGHDWSYAGHGAGGQPLVFERARVVGGCSAHNGCGLSVGWRGDYDRWAAAGCPGWSGEELTPLFERAAERMRVRRFDADEVQPFLRAYLDAAAATGVPETNDLGDLDGGVGCGTELMNVVDGIRWNASFAYLDPVRGRPELEVVSDALVDRLLIVGDRAVGVRAIVAGEVREHHADLVVVSAGAYGTPEVLLRSGIGAPDEVRRVGIEPRVDLPGVGANLHDQPAIELKFDGTSRLVEETTAFGQEMGWLPEEQVMVKLASPACEGPYDLHVYPWMERDAAQSSGWLCVIAVALLTPRSRGRLRLRSDDPHMRAELDHGFLARESDGRALVPGLRWAHDIQRSDPLGPYLGASLQVPLETADDATLIDWIRSKHAHYWHPAATCRMGPDTDPGAVVDAGGKVHGVGGLRVADASIFPALPRSTPTLPTVVVGERIADAVLGANA